jgi:hypothetical protein
MPDVPDEKAKADAAADKPRPSQSSPEREPEERRFSSEDLQADSRMRLGVSPAVVAGALATESNQTFTLKQAEQAVNEFLKRPVEREIYDPEAAT